MNVHPRRRDEEWRYTRISILPELRQIRINEQDCRKQPIPRAPSEANFVPVVIAIVLANGSTKVPAATEVPVTSICTSAGAIEPCHSWLGNNPLFWAGWRGRLHPEWGRATRGKWRTKILKKKFPLALSVPGMERCESHCGTKRAGSWKLVSRGKAPVMGIEFVSVQVCPNEAVPPPKCFKSSRAFQGHITSASANCSVGGCVVDSSRLDQNR
jgi:hypothetical protein